MILKKQFEILFTMALVFGLSDVSTIMPFSTETIQASDSSLKSSSDLSSSSSTTKIVKVERTNQDLSSSSYSSGSTASVSSSTSSTALGSSEAESQFANQTSAGKSITTAQSSANKAITTESASSNLITNKIIVPVSYATTLEDYFTNGMTDDSQLQSVASKARAVNTYQTDTSAQKVVVTTPDSLSDPELNELSDFAAGLINSTRQQLNVGTKVVVDQGALAFAKDVAKQYEKDNWDINQTQAHDLAAINAAATNNGLRVYRGINKYENASAGYLEISISGTLDDYQKAIYNTITDMLFNDASEDWLHALSITDLLNTSGSNVQYFAVSFDAFKQLHFEFVTAADIFDQAKFAHSQLDSQTPANSISTLTQKSNSKNLQISSANSVKFSNSLNSQTSLSNNSGAQTFSSSAKVEKASRDLKNSNWAKRASLKQSSSKQQTVRGQKNEGENGKLNSKQSTAQSASQKRDTLPQTSSKQSNNLVISCLILIGLASVVWSAVWFQKS
jgi:SEC10/PgrA surface exclusion-like protein